MNRGRFERSPTCERNRSRLHPSASDAATRPRAVRPLALMTLAAVIAALWLFAPAALAQQAPLTDADVAKIPAGPQPIAFSHKIHAGDNQIDCQYCHIYARRTNSSGAPPVAICVGCHKIVGAQLKEIQKVMGYWERQEPIPWVKIHDVPDFVRYPHYKHVGAKNEIYPDGVPCQECHGPIEKMDVVAKAKPEFGLMGWCLQCHLTIPGSLERKRAIAATTDPTKIKNAKHPAGNFTRPNLTDCLTCHY